MYQLCMEKLRKKKKEKRGNLGPEPMAVETTDKTLIFSLILRKMSVQVQVPEKLESL